jgi:hypothetical protein
MRENCPAGHSTWTNNNCASINHVLKLSANSRSQQLPQLIDSIKGIVDSQYLEADRALCGAGDFILRAPYTRHLVATDVWLRMTALQRRKAVAACFNSRSSVDSDNDPTLAIHTTPSAGKKPYQRTRMQSERTNRCNVKRRFIVSRSDSDVEQ